MAAPPQALLVDPSACLPFAVISPLLSARLVCRCRIRRCRDPWRPQRGEGGCRGPHGGAVEQRRVGLQCLSINTKSIQGTVTCSRESRAVKLQKNLVGFCFVFIFIFFLRWFCLPLVLGVGGGRWVLFFWFGLVGFFLLLFCFGFLEEGVLLSHPNQCL